MEIQNVWYRVSAKALIYNKKGEFLLVKEDNWVWDIPWGGLDHSENPQDCIKRELKEEMWLDVIEVSQNPKYFLTAHKPKSKKRPWIANIFYEVKVKNLDFTPSSECVAIDFFNKETVKNLNVIENVREFIKLL